MPDKSKILITLITVEFLIASKCYTQEVYQTKNGLCLIVAEYREKKIMFHSFKSIVSFHPKTSEFELVLPINSLHNGINYIEAMLSKAEDDDIRIIGNLKIDKNKIKSHLIYHFAFDAMIIQNDIKQKSIVNGQFQYLTQKNRFAYRLNISFEVQKFELFNGFTSNFEFHLLPSTLYQQRKY